MPVSPEAGYGQILLPQADFPVSASTGMTSTGSSGFLPQHQPPYSFNGSDAASRPTPSVVAPISENKWFQNTAGTSVHQTTPPCSISPPLQDASNFATPPPGYEMPGQMQGGLGQTLLGPPAENGYPSCLEMDARFGGEHPDRREEYIRQLEAENRYLRTCLIQYLGPNAPALSLLPPPPGAPPQQGYFRATDGLSIPDACPDAMAGPLPFGPCPPPPPGVPAPLPPGASSIPGSGMLPVSSTSQGLCANAPPFWPAWQEPAEIDTSSRFNAPHHSPGLEHSVPLCQDGNGNVMSTSSLGQQFSGE